MKLFLATNEKTAKTPNIKMLEVAVKSAIKNTDFEIYVIFDGDKKTLNLPEEVTIISHRHRCYDTFKSSSRCFNSEECLKIASGAFLRTEIPYLLDFLNEDDKFVIYTDYDVIFLHGDYSDLYSIEPEILAACPEHDKNNWSYINSGVMVKNINFFKDNDKNIVDYINSNFEKLRVWDQTMYNDLYINKGLNKLPLEYNWKPYWGINKDAKIIHFHGPKPYNITTLEEINKVPILKRLHSTDPKSYEYYNNIFNSFL